MRWYVRRCGGISSINMQAVLFERVLWYPKIVLFYCVKWKSVALQWYRNGVYKNNHNTATTPLKGRFCHTYTALLLLLVFLSSVQATDDTGHNNPQQTEKRDKSAPSWYLLCSPPERPQHWRCQSTCSFLFWVPMLIVSPCVTQFAQVMFAPCCSRRRHFVQSGIHLGPLLSVSLLCVWGPLCPSCAQGTCCTMR